MNSQDVFAQFHNQLLDLHAIAKAIYLESVIAGKPSDALTFAETLLLCPSEESAKEQMLLDQLGAVAFFQIASYVQSKFGELDIPVGRHNVTNSAPFFVAGACVQDYLQWLRQNTGDEWL